MHYYLFLIPTVHRPDFAVISVQHPSCSRAELPSLGIISRQPMIIVPRPMKSKTHIAIVEWFAIKILEKNIIKIENRIYKLN